MRILHKSDLKTVSFLIIVALFFNVITPSLLLFSPDKENAFGEKQLICTAAGFKYVKQDGNANTAAEEHCPLCYIQHAYGVVPEKFDFTRVSYATELVKYDEYNNSFVSCLNSKSKHIRAPPAIFV